MNARTARPARRNVVVLFIDLVGSTELAERLDPELLRQVLDRYYSACAAGVLEHGGVVEKYIGDAIMAVFGVPTSHEDDALRAIRAAHHALSAVRALGIEIAPTHGIRLDAHCGIASGEAMVVDMPESGLRVIGDTVNTAARLQGAATSGEILLGEDAVRLARTYVRVEEVPPLSLKGKARPVRAWRLLSLEATPQRQDDDLPLIGRSDELMQLTQAYRRVVRNRQCCLVTILGAPGIGKSRLVREFLRTLPEDVTTLVGQCPSYGSGATFRPIAEAIHSLPDAWTGVAPLLDAMNVRALRGLTTPEDGPFTELSVEETARSIRSLIEVLGQRRPTVVVVDNLHWAEPTLLELIEELAGWLADVSVLLICVARPELLDIRPNWGGGMSCALTVEIPQLGEAQMTRLVDALAANRWAGADVVAQSADPTFLSVVRNSDGNPLFAELMFEVLVEEGTDAPPPPTIQALLAARLDRLSDGEREVLERAATIGTTFTTEELGVLWEGEDVDNLVVDAPLRRLLRQRLIRRGTYPTSFQFAQTLARETVYTMTRKELRGAWHLKLADWLSERAHTGPPESDEAEIGRPRYGEIANHLEAACRIRREIHPDDPTLPALAVRAARTLMSDGEQALYRKDLPAAIALLERGRELLPRGDSGHRRLALHICDAAFAHNERDRAYAALDVAEEASPEDPRCGLTCAVQREILAIKFGVHQPELAPLRDALSEYPDDDLSWARFHQLDALILVAQDQFGAATTALNDALSRSRSLEDRYEEDRLLGALCELAQWSPVPVREGLDLCATLSTRFAGDRVIVVPVLVTRARLLALTGDVPGAHDVLDTAERYAGELRLDLALIAVTQVRGLVESLAGQHAAAATLFTRAAVMSRSAGQPAPAWTLQCYAIRELLRHGDVRAVEDGLAWLEVGRRPQLRGELLVACLRALIMSAGENHPEAVALAAWAAERIRSTDDPCLRGDVLMDIATVYRAAGRAAGAVDAAAEAERCYTAKGADLLAGRARDRLATFGETDR
ncbi:AAA family ATPase [Virgisporangium ochraceum]|uniref:Guanylate cyclase n=1 Tax=Virgisporangium ochraceum TaxID=65505 RepID=A0A8J4EDY5_9ACTN|nr:AAA family ATPase [Virgisporangium ochraceum]GIJ68457.1 guanylate cyclase [Virgisporangium ochraceum]